MLLGYQQQYKYQFCSISSSISSSISIDGLPIVGIYCSYANCSFRISFYNNDNSNDNSYDDDNNNDDDDDNNNDDDDNDDDDNDDDDDDDDDDDNDNDNDDDDDNDDDINCNSTFSWNITFFFSLPYRGCPVITSFSSALLISLSTLTINTFDISFSIPSFIDNSLCIVS